jgi:hypothetical protein
MAGGYNGGDFFGVCFRVFVHFIGDFKLFFN